MIDIQITSLCCLVENSSRVDSKTLGIEGWDTTREKGCMLGSQSLSSRKIGTPPCSFYYLFVAFFTIDSPFLSVPGDAQHDVLFLFYSSVLHLVLPLFLWIFNSHIPSDLLVILIHFIHFGQYQKLLLF